MLLSVDRYLSALLSFVPSSKNSGRRSGDYACLIHVPAHGAERVYALSLNTPNPILTTALYRETVWEFFDGQDGLVEGEVEASPQVDVLKANVDPEHPVFEYLNSQNLSTCENFSDGCPGLDYYMLIWKTDEECQTVECWEPYARKAHSWISMIGAIQSLSSQFEYAIKAGDDNRYAN